MTTENEATRLHAFICTQVLTEDTFSNMVNLLGTLPSLKADGAPERAILRIEKTPLTSAVAQRIAEGSLQDIKLIERNDIYSWMHGWTAVSPDMPDVKISVICPATDVHVQKYSAQKNLMVHETPKIYEEIVKPFILSFPPSRTQWVEDILNGKSEADKILYRHVSSSDVDPSYIILPDMKWDTATLSSLYLVAIAATRDIRSLRDLRKVHLPFLKSIRLEASRVVKEKWTLDKGKVRLFVHYQPSYYHFHVHIVHVDYIGLPGMHAGHAHLLDDIISMLELDADNGPGIFEKMTLTYSLGERHGLYAPLKAAQEYVDDT